MATNPRKARLRRGWAWSAEEGFHRKKEPRPRNLQRKPMTDKPPSIPKTNPAEAASLGNLLDLINATNGATPPIGAALATPTTEALMSTAEPESEAPPEEALAGKVWIEDPPPAPPPPAAVRTNKLFFTGRLGVGKDFVAAAAGANILSFAAPLYALASYYFGIEVTSTKGKDIPGIREFLQAAGQFGRGTVNEKYPLTIGRALWIKQVRADGIAGYFEQSGVDWASYGHNPEIWLDACIQHANKYLEENPGARVAVTNCRFQNEFARLQAEGFSHYHVMTSAKTWSARLLQAKLTPESPAVKDISEQLAAKLDANVIKQVSTVKSGPKLRVVWSDEAVPKPSERLHTVQSFLQSI